MSISNPVSDGITVQPTEMLANHSVHLDGMKVSLRLIADDTTVRSAERLNQHSLYFDGASGYFEAHV